MRSQWVLRMFGVLATMAPCTGWRLPLNGPSMNHGGPPWGRGGPMGGPYNNGGHQGPHNGPPNKQPYTDWRLPYHNDGSWQPDNEHVKFNDAIRLARDQLGLSNGSLPGKGHRHRFSSRSTPLTEDIGLESSINLKAFQILQKTAKPENIVNFLSNRLPSTCKRETPTCDEVTRYRTIDGTCNNLQNPFWGASFTAFDRLLASAYDNLFDDPRGGSISTLPNARLISTTIHYDISVEDTILTSMVAQFGQFVDHDITFTPNGNKLCCTTDQGSLGCWPLSLPADDAFYSDPERQQTCMSFVRSSPYCFPNKHAGAPLERQQMNTLTAFVDASQVYGSDETRARQLRTFQNGMLRMKLPTAQIPENKLLPTVDEVRAATKETIDFTGTFFAGDNRANEMPSLAVLQTLFAREHNRIAMKINQLSPSLDDETVYLTARRILGAEFQNIVYGEYLPIILGAEAMRDFNLEVGKSFTTYDPSENPNILNAFATAAYRFGHSMVTGPNLLMKNLTQIGSYDLRDNYAKSEQVFGPMLDGSGYERILEGLTMQPPQTCDNYVTGDMTNYLFRKDYEDFGQDLMARNLLRGRDHGLPSYNEYRKLCRLKPLPRTFSTAIDPEVQYGFTAQAWQELQEVYAKPGDIDLFTGGMAEKRITGAQTGPTFNCIMATQFRRTKFGDRFFFTHSDTVGSFNSIQLAHIRKRKLSDIICDNSDIERIPIDVFRSLNSPSNRIMNCNSTKPKERVTLDVNLLMF